MEDLSLANPASLEPISSHTNFARTLPSFIVHTYEKTVLRTSQPGWCAIVAAGY